MSDDIEKVVERKFTLQVALIGAGAGVLAALLGGGITLLATVYVQHNQNANNQEATIQSRAATLIATADQICRVAVNNPNDEQALQLQTLAANLDSAYYALQLASKDPITLDASQLVSDAEYLDQISMSEQGSKLRLPYEDVLADINGLVTDINPNDHAFNPAPSAS